MGRTACSKEPTTRAEGCASGAPRVEEDEDEDEDEDDVGALYPSPAGASIDSVPAPAPGPIAGKLGAARPG